MRKNLIHGLIIFLMQNMLTHGATLSFSFSLLRSGDLGRSADLGEAVAIRLEFALIDPLGQAEQAVKRLESNGKMLTTEERLDGVRYYLWRCRILQAHKVAEELVSATQTNHLGALTALAIAQICRGDYAAASRSLDLLRERNGAEVLHHWNVYIKAVALNRANEMEPIARMLVESSAVNRQPSAIIAVLGTCLALDNGRSLFAQFQQKFNADLVRKDSDEERLLLALVKKYGNDQK